MSDRVKIHIKSTNQYTTATWKLEGCGNADIWVCVLEDISDFQWLTFWKFSSVRIEFNDGRIKERMFYYDPLRVRLTQVDSDELSFWTSKESEEKSMLHNVTVKHEESKVLKEEGATMLAIKKEWEGSLLYTTNGVKKEETNRIIDTRELDHKPKPDEIAQFLSDSKADFVSVAQNYRFENELPFC